MTMTDDQRQRMMTKLAPLIADLVGVLAEWESKNDLGLDENIAVLGALEGIFASRVQKHSDAIMKRMAPSVRAFVESTGGAVAVVMPALAEAHTAGFDFGVTIEQRATALHEHSRPDDTFTEQQREAASKLTADVFAGLRKKAGGDGGAA